MIFEHVLLWGRIRIPILIGIKMKSRIRIRIRIRIGSTTMLIHNTGCILYLYMCVYNIL